MPDITLIYRAQAAGLSLALELRSPTVAAEDPINGAGGTAFTESETEPGFYSVEISDTYAGDRWAAVMVDSVPIAHGLVTIPDTEGPHNLNALLDRLDANWSNLQDNLRAMIGGSGDAAAFTATALANAPFWGAEGDPSPIIYVPLGLQVDPRMRESSLRLFTGEKNYQVSGQSNRQVLGVPDSRRFRRDRAHHHRHGRQRASGVHRAGHTDGRASHRPHLATSRHHRRD